MVSFQCESCGDVLTKKKLDPHRSRCRGATFSCIDCMVYFNGTDYRSHTSCMTEDQKYQGALYKNKNKKVKLNPPANTDGPSFNITTPINRPAASRMAAAVQQHHVSHNAYVEDVAEDVNDYLVRDDDDDDSGRSDDDDDNAPPHAPTPPPAQEGPVNVNVFDFLVASAGTTPNTSSMSLTRGPAGPANLGDSTQVVPYDRSVDDFRDRNDGYELVEGGSQPLMGQSGTGGPVSVPASVSVPVTAPAPVPAPVSVPAAVFQTPAPIDRSERRRRDVGSDRDVKKDKKRKRLTLDINDRVMTDAPPVLHSGLTGGLRGLTTRHTAAFPPSPDSAETPASPLKKSKHAKHAKSRSETVGGGIFAALSSKPKTKKRKHRSASPSDKKHKDGQTAGGEHRNRREHREHREHRHHRRHSHHKTDDEKKAAATAATTATTTATTATTATTTAAVKLIEYPTNKDGEQDASGQLIVYKPRADLFLSFVNKGPESERGCSMNRTLKRFHRERTSSGKGQDRETEEKELFRSLRLRKNDRGETVIFFIDP